MTLCVYQQNDLPLKRSQILMKITCPYFFTGDKEKKILHFPFTIIFFQQSSTVEEKQIFLVVLDFCSKIFFFSNQEAMQLLRLLCGHLVEFDSYLVRCTKLIICKNKAWFCCIQCKKGDYCGFFLMQLTLNFGPSFQISQTSDKKNLE